METVTAIVERARLTRAELEGMSPAGPLPPRRNESVKAGTRPTRGTPWKR